MIQGGAGTITTATASGNGALNSVRHIKGGTSSGLRVIAFLSSYTMCAITRYDGSNRGRILTEHAASNILLGHHFGRAKVHFGFWLTDSAFSPGNILDWQVTCAQSGNSAPNNVIVDGINLPCILNLNEYF